MSAAGIVAIIVLVILLAAFLWGQFVLAPRLKLYADSILAFINALKQFSLELPEATVEIVEEPTDAQ